MWHRRRHWEKRLEVGSHGLAQASALLVFPFRGLLEGAARQGPGRRTLDAVHQEAFAQDGAEGIFPIDDARHARQQPDLTRPAERLAVPPLFREGAVVDLAELGQDLGPLLAVELQHGAEVLEAERLAVDLR